MKTSGDYSALEIPQRYKSYHGKEKKAELLVGQIPFYQDKWASISEYVKESKESTPKGRGIEDTPQRGAKKLTLLEG